MSAWTAAFLSLLAALSVLLAYGIFSAGLFEQEIWFPEGLQKLIWYTASYAAVSALFIVWRPRWFRPMLLGTAVAYTTVMAGPSAIGTLALCLVAGYVLGRSILRRAGGAIDDLLSLMLGLSLIAATVGLAVHAHVNYPAIYVAALLIPLLAARTLRFDCFRRVAALFCASAVSSRMEMAAQALLGFVLSAHLLVTLKPEAGSDGLAMHLAIPAWVAQHHAWSFDFQHFVWAMMPMAGDWIFTAVFLPGGEYAARLLNFSMLCWLAALVFYTVRKWTTPASAYVATTLFCSSPLVQLETGTLFVENFWAALLTGSLAALWRFHETQARRYFIVAGALLGAAMQTKVGALAFFVPLGILGGWMLARANIPHGLRPAALAILAFLVFAAPPYVNAYLKTGNPVFPFANAFFRSPHFESGASFADLRFRTPLTWDALYTITIHTDRFLESQKGALGFQYLLLMPLLVLAMRRKWPLEAWTAMAVAVPFLFLTFSASSNLRYLYPVLVLWSLGIGWLLAVCRNRGAAHIAASSAALCAIALNTYFLPASGWYHKDFFLNPFHDGSARDYVVRTAPARALIDYMNVNHPEEALMLIESTDIAGARGPIYTNRWHTYNFRQELLETRNSTSVLRLMNRYGLRHFIAPAESSGIAIAEPALQSFLSEFTSPEHEAGKYYVARLDSKYIGAAPDAPITGERKPVPPGAYDDSGARISFEGRWYRDQQFTNAKNGTLTYSATPGDLFRLSFIGTGITYIHTRAQNRGIAEVFIDGRSAAKVDMYSSALEWQASLPFDGLPAGRHEFEVRITPEKNPASSDTFVDVDALIVK